MKKSECGRFFKEASEHVAEHTVGHIIGGAIGSGVSALLHVGTLGEGENKIVTERMLQDKERAQKIDEALKNKLSNK